MLECIRNAIPIAMIITACTTAAAAGTPRLTHALCRSTRSCNVPGVGSASTQPVLRACRTPQLHVWMTRTGAAGGTVGGYLAFTNRGATACRFSGWPTMTALRPGASTTAAHVHATMFGPYVGGQGPHVRGVPHVRLRHGQTAVAAFTTGDHGPTSAPCPPPYQQLRITPPGSTTSVVIPAWIIGYAQDLPSCTRIQVSMLVPASDMPPHG
jgi:hypothetical protein